MASRYQMVLSNPIELQLLVFFSIANFRNRS